MGRMKDVFMEIMEKYGEIPADYTLRQYHYEKEHKKGVADTPREKIDTETKKDSDSREDKKSSIL